jgi:hypothetical protein
VGVTAELGVKRRVGSKQRPFTVFGTIITSHSILENHSSTWLSHEELMEMKCR